jgi:hypothetical protein
LARRAPKAGSRAEVLDAALRFLRTQDKPTKTAEILEHLRQLGVEVSGKVPANTISSVLSKSDKVESLGWAVGWVVKEKNAADDAIPGEETSSTLFESRFSHPAEPPAEGRKAGPGGGT